MDFLSFCVNRQLLCWILYESCSVAGDLSTVTAGPKYSQILLEDSFPRIFENASLTVRRHLSLEKSSYSYEVIFEFNFDRAR